MGLKIAALRLGKTAVILTRNSNKFSLAQLSTKFIADSGKPYLVAPLVCYEQVEQDVLRPLTPHSGSVFQLVQTYTAPIFTSEL